MSDFLAATFPNLVGAAFGVGLALFIDRLIERHRRKTQLEKEERDRDEAEATQLRLVQWLVEENTELGEQLLGVLEAGEDDRSRSATPYFRMNTHLLDQTLAVLSTTCEDLQLLWHSEQYRYQLHHLNAKLESLTTSLDFPGIDTARSVRYNRDHLILSITSHVRDMILPAGAALLPDLNRRVQVLSSIQKPPIRPRLVNPKD